MHTFGQAKLSPQETLRLLEVSNNMYCYVIKDLIECMGTFDQAKFDNALLDLKTVRQNYDNIEKNGTLTGSGAQISLARSRFNANRFGALSLFVNEKAYKNDKRSKTVKYNAKKMKIPKSLAKQFKSLVSMEDRVCY